MDDEGILETSRLLLRFQRETDIPFLTGLWMDEDMTAFTGGPRERSFLIGEFTKVAKDPKAEEYDLWTIESLETGEPIGQAGFIPKDLDGKRCIELNYYIDKRHWGKGYATEMAKALMDFAFAEKRLDGVVAIIDKGNEASIRVAEKTGMTFMKAVVRPGGEKSIFGMERE